MSIFSGVIIDWLLYKTIGKAKLNSYIVFYRIFLILTYSFKSKISTFESIK